MPHKLIIDTDPGVDDAQAIAFAVAHPDIELLGLTTVFGNAEIEITTRNALKLAEMFGLGGLPVAQGAKAPINQPRFSAPDFVHGEDALGNLNLDPPEGKAVAESAAEFIVSQANIHNGELVIVAIGPLTNLALALELDPTLPSKVKQLVVMGGTVLEPGNVTPVAEANFINDAFAADKVLAQDWNLTTVGLDVTHRTLLYDHDLQEISAATGTVGKFLWQSSRYYFNFYREARDLTPGKESCAPMHDASALVYLVEPNAFTCVSGAACVATEGVALGQMIFDRKANEYFLDDWAKRSPVKVAMQVDAEQIRHSFVSTISAAF